MLLLAPPTKQFAAIAQVAAPAVFPASDDAASIADIEQTLLLGAHGPRSLRVFLIDGV